MRADVYLFSHGMSESRTRAGVDIENGRLFVNGKPIKKSSYDIKEGDNVELRGEAMPFVGRGGLKLAGAIEAFGTKGNTVSGASSFLAGNACFDPKGAVCVDIGASTGGFTDCLLHAGAKKVFAVDCGSGQLHEKLRADGRVINIENFNARELTAEFLGERCDVAVMDVSFISQVLLYPAAARILKPQGQFITLIKPQFEAGRAALGNNGVVRDKKVHAGVILQTVNAAKEYGFLLSGLARSPITGGDGNAEYLAFYTFLGENTAFGTDIGVSELLLTSELLKKLTGAER